MDAIEYCNDMDFTGEFETHLTIRADHPSRIDKLRRWSHSHGLKFTHIVLDRGTTVSQPMLTRSGSGTFAKELQAALNLQQDLGADDVEVTRIKIEAAPINFGVPQSNAEAETLGARYFEHHIKLLLPQNSALSELRNIAESHSAHLSRNALRVREDGQHERFVTQRCASIGRTNSRTQLDALLMTLRSLGHPILDVEEEYVVYDSNIDLDTGWLNS